MRARFQTAAVLLAGVCATAAFGQAPVAPLPTDVPPLPQPLPQPLPLPLPEPVPAPPAPPTTPAQPPDPLLFQHGPLRVKVGFEAITQGSWGANTWWRLTDRLAPTAGYNPDRYWHEGWFKPSVRTDITPTEWLGLYSGASFVGSGTLGRDVFEQGYQGLISTEDAYLGVRFGNPTERKTIDLSYGQQQYRIGSGMLIAVGAQNGFERGAVTTFARRAWAEAALAKANWGPVSFDTFYLRPNELRSGDTNNQLAGSKAELALGENQYVGLAYMNVFHSTLPYLAAPVRLIENGRDGLNTLHSYLKVNPLREALPGFFVAGDFAYQWNDRIDMRAFAYSGEAGYAFDSVPLKPRASYGFRYFGGDDPATRRYEKFDPLFYEGSPALWSAGSNGSLAFLNSNVLAHKIALSLTVTPRDYVNLYYWHLRAPQVNSPLQFGQFARVDVSGGEPRLVSGVPNAHLADDFYAEYTRAVTANVFVTTGFAVSIPGRGLTDVAPDARTWFGGLVNVAIKY